MDGEGEATRRGERVAAILGQVLWLMSQSPKHKHLTLADMDWLVVPALLHRQFKLYRLDGKPFAYASWAYLSPDILERLRDGEGRLGAGEWKSGDNAWLIDVVAPFGGAEGIVKDLKSKVFGETFLQENSLG